MNGMASETRRGLLLHGSRTPARCFFADGTISSFANGLLGCWRPCTAAPADARESVTSSGRFSGNSTSENHSQKHESELLALCTDDLFGEHLFSSSHCECVDAWDFTTRVHDSERFLPGLSR
jgi:hypothetical protein